MERDHIILDHIAAEAAKWFTQLREAEVTAADRAEFTRWLLRSPAHIQEYLGVVRAWNDVNLARGGELSPELAIEQALASGLPDNVTALREEPVPAKDAPWQARGVPRSLLIWSRHRTPLVSAAMVTLLLIVGLAVLLPWRYPAYARTAVGEQRSVRLSDGSTLELNTDSELRVDFKPHERLIHLLHGEARFVVAKDPARPFIVAADNARIRALGTVFNVRHTDGDTSVGVFEGRVAIEAVESTVESALVLATGERATILPQGEIVPNTGPPLERQRAWRTHRLVFQGESLEVLVTEVNRYHSHPIIIGDPRLASLKISGTFSANDLDSLIQYLEQYRGIRARSTEEGGYILFSLAP